MIIGWLIAHCFLVVNFNFERNIPLRHKPAAKFPSNSMWNHGVYRD